MIQDLKADSARWEQERRSHSGGTKTSRGSPDSFMRSTKSNSPPARYSESSHRFSGAGGPAQYETYDLSYPRGSSCDSYTVIPRYPGSDAPGYSGSNVSSQSYQQYDNRTSGYNAAQYQGQPQAYPPPAVDSRYSTQGQASPNTPYNGQTYPGIGANHADSAPYVNVGAHQRYAQSGYDSQDARMVDASSSRVYSSGSGYPAQGPQDPRAAYYSTSQVSGGVAYSPQPVDSFVGRGSNYPATSQAEYGTPAPQVPYQYVTEAPQYETKSTPPPRAATSTSTQAQTGHSGSSHSRREHRDRDSYSKTSSDRHHRRTQQ